MASPIEESFPPERRDAVIRKVATGGRESAARLKALIHEALAGSGALDPASGALVEHVLGSFLGVISELDPGDAPEVGPESVTLQADSPGNSNNREIGNSTRKRKIQPAVRDRRGGCRRRGNPCSWKRITSATINDGHTWRKYGQKEIFSAKYPRSYFRCTHKYDRGCQAQRQVQQSEEDAAMFQITYMGEHTCKEDAIKASQIPATSRSHPRASCVINFGGSNTTEEGQEPSFASSLKRECDEEVVSGLTPQSVLPLEFFVPPELPAAFFEGFTPMTQQIADVVAPDNGDATSLQSSTSCLDFMNDEVFDLEDVLSFAPDESLHSFDIGDVLNFSF